MLLQPVNDNHAVDINIYIHHTLKTGITISYTVIQVNNPAFCEIKRPRMLIKHVT